MGYELKGTVIKVYETKVVSDKFSKREFVVETNDNPKYPQTILLQATGDRIAQVNDLNVGDAVRVEFSIRGRAWQDKHFNSLDVWRVERTSAAASTDGQSTAPASDNAQDETPF